MGHNDGTQSPSNPMPKHPHILKRDGRYYYQKRIPADLVRAGCYGKTEIIKRSLKTGDLVTANRLAMSVALEVDLDFDAKRREIGLASRFAKSAKSGEAPAKRRLADISDIERRDFVIRQFIASEKLESAVRSFESDPDTRGLKLEVAREDLGAIEGSPHYAGTDWLSVARKALEADGISTDATRDAAALRSIADMLRRAAMENAWRTERSINGSPFDARDAYFDAFHQDSPLPQAAKASKTVADLCRDYLAHNHGKVKAGNLARSTIPKIEMRCRILADFFGEGRALASITSEDVARMVDFLPTLPHSATKRYKGLSLVTAAERESEAKAKRLIHAETADDYLTGLSAMLSYAVERRWMNENPLKGRLVRDRMKKPKKRDRQTLLPDEMAKVFSSSDFLAQKQGGRATPEARYWVPLLCLFHGTRANEVAGMRVADVMETDAIPFLNLCETEEHRLKNSNSERRVPLHRALVDLGFLEFVARRREQEPGGHLFPGLNRNKNGSMADGVCKWWQRHVTRILGPAPADGPTGARGIHSLRHSWVAAARSAGLDDSTRKRLGGWSQADAADGYGWNGALPMLKAAIDKIEFPKVDFSSLRPAGEGQ